METSGLTECIKQSDSTLSSYSYIKGLKLDMGYYDYNVVNQYVVFFTDLIKK